MSFDISNIELSPVKRDVRVASAKVGDPVFIVDEEINRWTLPICKTHTSGLTPI